MDRGGTFLELFHFKLASGNFGDDLNLWLWDEILPGWQEALPGQLLVGVGTLINDKLPRGMPKMVLGSGIGYGNLPDADLMSECRFVAVRGPRSAAALGLPPETGIIDPAVLITDLPAFQNVPKSDRPVFVPHHASVRRADWEHLCRKAGVDYLSPQGDARQIIRRLAGAPLVITESMHGAIIADAFGTPWHAVTTSPHILKSKWLDWADSLGITFNMGSLFPVSERIARRFPQNRKVSNGAVGRQPNLAAIPTRAPTSNFPRPKTMRQRLQRMLLVFESQIAVARLRRLSATPGTLSDRSRLMAAKARYRAALEGALWHDV